MQGHEERTPAGTDRPPGAEPGRGWVGPDLPSLSGVLIGSALFLTGGMLIFTVIGIAPGLVLFGAGLGLMLTPKRRAAR